MGSVRSTRTETDAKVAELLRVAKDALGLSLTFLSRFDGPTQHLDVVESSIPLFRDGQTQPLETSFCQAIIDGNSTDKSVQKNAAVTALLGKLRYKEQCWFVANTTAMMEKVAEELGERGEFKGTRAVKAVQNVMFSANVGSKADLYGEALCDSEDNSQLLTEAMKGALATAKLAVSDDRDAVDMLNRIDVDRAGKAVKMSASLDKTFFDKMRERAEKHGKAVALF